MINLIKNILSIFVLIIGILIYFFFKKNTILGHQSLVKSYIFTSGRINKFLSKIISICSKNNEFNNNLISSPSLEYLSDKDNINDINKDLLENGYSILKNRLSKADVDDLLKFANDNSEKFMDEIRNNNFDINSSTFSYNENNLLQSSLIKKLSINKFFLKIAKNYFLSTPIISAINMWWSIPSKKIDSKAGQMFHFDMDRIKFLKFFIYLTDVDIENGPHCYVEGTHKVSAKKRLLDRGYVRIPDSDIEKNYDQRYIKTILGKAGTIIVGDTSCFHKGLPPTNFKRLVLEVEYSNSLFGTETEKILDTTKEKLRNDLLFEPLIKIKSDILKRYY